MAVSPLVSVFEGIRPEDQDTLMIVMDNGTDVAVQQVARIEESVVMIRGRIGGTADNGRIFIIPFERITCVYVNRIVRTDEIDLFSPGIPLEKKKDIAKQVSQNKERERAALREAEAERNGKPSEDKLDVRRQLEALREAAGFGGATQNERPGATMGALPVPPAAPGTMTGRSDEPAAASILPPRPNLNRNPVPAR
jgi:hypothetical protein